MNNMNLSNETCLLQLSGSVTKFGEISPLRQNFKRLWEKLKGLFSIWLNSEHTLANSLCYWANFQCCK